MRLVWCGVVVWSQCGGVAWCGTFGFSFASTVGFVLGFDCVFACGVCRDGDDGMVCVVCCVWWSVGLRVGCGVWCGGVAWCGTVSFSFAFVVDFELCFVLACGVCGDGDDGMVCVVCCVWWSVGLWGGVCVWCGGVVWHGVAWRGVAWRGVPFYLFCRRRRDGIPLSTVAGTVLAYVFVHAPITYLWVICGGVVDFF